MGLLKMPKRCMDSVYKVSRSTREDERGFLEGVQKKSRNCPEGVIWFIGS